MANLNSVKETTTRYSVFKDKQTYFTFNLILLFSPLFSMLWNLNSLAGSESLILKALCENPKWLPQVIFKYLIAIDC